MTKNSCSRAVLVSLSIPLCRSRLQSKIKAIGRCVYTWHFYAILISATSWIVQKPVEKEPNRKNTWISIFLINLRISPSRSPFKRKQNWSVTQRWNTSSHFFTIHSITCARAYLKYWITGPQRPEILKTAHISYIWAFLHDNQDHKALLHGNQDYKAKQKPSGTQFHVALLWFYKILIYANS